eukprot:NODE_1109_length_1102_cov_90.996201_g847_i0.p1 GENE.NODE_1109_length_1102_cov_90.996201_g847_i0~~NODE_1109_length_1102_cov_90.996201_g847_i0.p1  ORF type:complete len:325 (-),score=61.47 NODE_1109_length_1102_cov_90.996201_g847_i0:127-1002(-)
MIMMMEVMENASGDASPEWVSLKGRYLRIFSPVHHYNVEVWYNKISSREQRESFKNSLRDIWNIRSTLQGAESKPPKIKDDKLLPADVSRLFTPLGKEAVSTWMQSVPSAQRKMFVTLFSEVLAAGGEKGKKATSTPWNTYQSLPSTCVYLSYAAGHPGDSFDLAVRINTLQGRKGRRSESLEQHSTAHRPWGVVGEGFLDTELLTTYANSFDAAKRNAYAEQMMSDHARRQERQRRDAEIRQQKRIERNSAANDQRMAHYFNLRRRAGKKGIASHYFVSDVPVPRTEGID